MLRRAPTAVALALVALLVLAGGATPQVSNPLTDVHPITLDVDGEPAQGLIALPDGVPKALVVVMHGYGHKAESHREHLYFLAQRDGAAAIAMDFRGEGFPLRAGADDTKAATAHLRSLYPGVETVILYSVSMGTAAASMVLAESPGVFDYWVNNEGLSMLTETWAGAKALSLSGHPTAVKGLHDIEAECDGSPLVAPSCYAERNTALRAHEFVGLKSVYLTHGLHDGLVPYNQGREMVAALRAAGIPSDFYTVVRGEPCQEGTTLLGYAGVTCTGFAGHGSESNDNHTLTKVSFELLYDLVNGKLAPAADRELVIDRDVAVVP